MGKIYTKQGDGGETSLIGGSRVKKSDPQVDLYGEVDELNVRIGLALSSLPRDSSLSSSLRMIQGWLFDLGTILACEEKKREKFLPSITQTHIDFLEREIDKMEGELSSLKNFILPGGHLSACWLHMARAQTRKIERKLFPTLPSEVLIFINRLSDYFFVSARWANQKEGVEEPLWEFGGQT